MINSYELQGHKEIIQQFKVSPLSTWAISISIDKETILWRLQDQFPIYRCIPNDQNSIISFCFTQKEEFVLLQAKNNRIHFISLTSGARRKKILRNSQTKIFDYISKLIFVYQSKNGIQIRSFHYDKLIRRIDMQEVGYFEFKLSIDRNLLIISSGNQIKIINISDLNQQNYEFQNIAMCYALSENNKILIIQDIELQLIIQNLETNIANVIVMKQAFNHLDMRGQGILYCFDHNCHIVFLNPFKRKLKLHSGCIIQLQKTVYHQLDQFHKIHITGILSPNNRYIFLPGIDNKIKMFRKMNQLVKDYIFQL